MDKKKSNVRLGRIDEELKKKISNIITFELKNSEITGLVSVTKVKITPDLRYAKVYISLLNSKSKVTTVEALKKSSGYIRTQIAKSINLRITPELVFELDESMETGERIDNILKEIKQENKKFQ